MSATTLDGNERECEHPECIEWCDHPSRGYYLNDGICTWVPYERTNT